MGVGGTRWIQETREKSGRDGSRGADSPEEPVLQSHFHKEVFQATLHATVQTKLAVLPSVQVPLLTLIYVTHATNFLASSFKNLSYFLSLLCSL